MLTITALKDYLHLREKYITSFIIMSNNELPTDVIGYVAKMMENTFPPLVLFDKDIKDVVAFVDPKITLKKDAYYLLNFIIHVFLTKTIKDGNVIRQHRRVHMIAPNDLEHGLGIYHKNGLDLTDDMIHAGNKAVEKYKENTDRSHKVRANVLMTPIRIKNLIDSFTEECVRNMNWRERYLYREPYKYNRYVSIFLAGVLEKLLLVIIRKAKEITQNNKMTTENIIEAMSCDNDLHILFMGLYI